MLFTRPIRERLLRDPIFPWLSASRNGTDSAKTVSLLDVPFRIACGRYIGQPGSLKPGNSFIKQGTSVSFILQNKALHTMVSQYGRHCPGRSQQSCCQRLSKHGSELTINSRILGLLFVLSVSTLPPESPRSRDRRFLVSKRRTLALPKRFFSPPVN